MINLNVYIISNTYKILCCGDYLTHHASIDRDYKHGLMVRFAHEGKTTKAKFFDSYSKAYRAAYLWNLLFSPNVQLIDYGELL